MAFVVPFDGSELAEAALVRAREFGTAFDEQVIAVSVIPRGGQYAVEHGWVDSREQFDIETVRAKLEQQVKTLVTDAQFKYKIVDRRPPSGAIASTIRNMARHADASIVFIGSDNAGKIVTPVSSVASTVAAEQSYDVHIVREPTPAKLTSSAA